MKTIVQYVLYMYLCFVLGLTLLHLKIELFSFDFFGLIAFMAAIILIIDKKFK